jgi:hypothetical protein
MRCLLTGEALYFNRSYNRSGHLNPMRAGLVADIAELDGYVWSGMPLLWETTNRKGRL